MGVPNNCGYGYQKAHTGIGYGGICCERSSSNCDYLSVN
jgi:hypothetical protein